MGEQYLVEPTDLTPVLESLEGLRQSQEQQLEHIDELLEQQIEIQMMQHNDLLQLQANVEIVFLAIIALIGVTIGCAVSRVLHDLWRT